MTTMCGLGGLLLLGYCFELVPRLDQAWTISHAAKSVRFDAQLTFAQIHTLAGMAGREILDHHLSGA